MEEFIQLFLDLDETRSSNKKITLLKEYLVKAEPEDAAWVVFFLSGNRLKRFISGKKLRLWARELLKWPKWLFDEAMIETGDTAEAIALTIDTQFPNRKHESELKSLANWMEKLQAIQKFREQDQKEQITSMWQELSANGIFILNKLITGGFRVGVSKHNTARAVADLYNLEKSIIIHRLMGNWKPSKEFYRSLISEETTDSDKSKPYPFFLASPLEDDLFTLGKLSEWLVEWKWDGIRAQLVKRDNEVFLWSRGEELINSSFPRLVQNSEHLPNEIVLDGEIIAYHDGKPLAFSLLQRRIGRENISQQILNEAPVIMVIFDILEYRGEDIRDLQLKHRRDILKNLFETNKLTYSQFKLSPKINSRSWRNLEDIQSNARDRMAEGVILKRISSAYQTGRVRGDWWKWKVDPLSIDAIMIYAQSGSGRRASLFTDYTFALWDENQELVPIGKAYSGLTDDEIRELDNWIRRNTTEKFGPVRSVTPQQVFEIGFDGIMTNNKAKSGVSLRFPRILRWRKDKSPDQANKIEDIKKLLKYEGITKIERYHSLDEFF